MNFSILIHILRSIILKPYLTILFDYQSDRPREVSNKTPFSLDFDTFEGKTQFTRIFNLVGSCEGKIS